MTTPSLTNGSPVSEWIRVEDEPDTPVTDSWYGWPSNKMVIDLDNVFRGLFSGSVRAVADTREEFERLAAEWTRETAHLSSPNTIAEHRAYQEIIGMGKEVIPHILEDLKHSKAQWFWALRSIARESPVRPKDRGDVDAMTAAWLKWGSDHNYWNVEPLPKRVLDMTWVLENRA